MVISSYVPLSSWPRRHPGLIDDGFSPGPSFQGTLTPCSRRMARFSELSAVTWVMKGDTSVWPSAQPASRPRTFSSASTVSSVPPSPSHCYPGRGARALAGAKGMWSHIFPNCHVTSSLLLLLSNDGFFGFSFTAVALVYIGSDKGQLSISSVRGKPG